MQNYYKIKELSRLYGLCTDTLRYYEEQGLLTPKRGENNYRLFGVQDIGKLNIIRSLRELDVPIERIREYIGQRTVDSTLKLMEEEEEAILEKIESLKRSYEEIRMRKKELLADSRIEDGRFSIRFCEARPCFQLSEDFILENDIDFLLKKLEKKYEENIHVIGIKGFGSRMDQKSLDQGIYNHFESVFFISDWDNYNSVIPEGNYASLYYRGEYERVEEMLPRLLSRIGEAGKKAGGCPMELYHIDMSDTLRHEEYLTEIQIKVEEGPEEESGKTGKTREKDRQNS